MTDDIRNVTVGGVEYPLRHFELSINGIPTPARELAPGEVVRYERGEPLPEIATGKVAVTGTMTCYFQNTALLEEYCRRDVELDAFLRQIILKPAKADAWAMALPYLRRAGIVLLVIAASLLFITGAA